MPPRERATVLIINNWRTHHSNCCTRAANVACDGFARPTAGATNYLRANPLKNPLGRLISALDWRVDRTPAESPGSTQLLATEYGPTSVSRRRLGNLAVFLAVGTAASVMGYIPWQVPAMLVPWMAGVWLTTENLKRASDARAKEWIETGSYCLDAVWLTAACSYLGGANWIASAFYVLLVITAAASLPMGKATLVAGVAWAGFAALALGEATGALTLPAFGPVANDGTSLSFAVLTVVIQLTTLVLALLLQQALLGALRQSEARHRAILTAASDMVVLLDHCGVIQRATEVFAERTRFPIFNLVGSRFSDIVDKEYRETWDDQLRLACTGERAPFEIAYRSKHANQGWIAGTLVPLPPEDGEARVLVIARDVSAEHSRQRPARMA